MRPVTSTFSAHEKAKLHSSIRQDASLIISLLIKAIGLTHCNDVQANAMTINPVAMNEAEGNTGPKNDTEAERIVEADRDTEAERDTEADRNTGRTRH
jgi:hypothetical protein